MIEELPGLTFGFIDNAVLIFGAYTGLAVDRLFKGNGALGAVVGAGFGNTASDALGALVDPSMAGMAPGIVIGCLVPMLAIPLIQKFRSAR